MLVKCFPVPLVRVSVEWFASPLNVVVLSLELLSPSVEPQTCMVFGLSHPSTLHPAVAGEWKLDCARMALRLVPTGRRA